MTFSDVCNKFVTQKYSKAETILEYGSGGSTILAASLGKKIISVESSSTWLLELIGSAAEQELPGKIIPLYVDVGPTGDWGKPKDESKWKNWLNYPRLPWQYCQQNRIDPDLVLIDGRFRVACFLATCAYVQKETTVLFDDYEERPHYHIVEKSFEKIDVIDGRMAVFKIKPNKLDSNDLMNCLHYFNDLN